MNVLCICNDDVNDARAAIHFSISVCLYSCMFAYESDVAAVHPRIDKFECLVSGDTNAQQAYV